MSYNRPKFIESSLLESEIIHTKADLSMLRRVVSKPLRLAGSKRYAFVNWLLSLIMKPLLICLESGSKRQTGGLGLDGHSVGDAKLLNDANSHNSRICAGSHIFKILGHSGERFS